MNKKDNILKALEACINWKTYNYCEKCPYFVSSKCDYDLNKDVIDLIKRQDTMIERLKAENEELTKVVSSKVYDLIDNTKEIADAREAWEKQAKIDVLNELWGKVKDKGVDYKIGMRALSEEIDEMIKELAK